MKQNMQENDQMVQRQGAEEYEIHNMTRMDFAEMGKLWRTVFERKFLVPDERLKYCLFEDPDFCLESSFVCRNRSTQELTGILAVKVSAEKQLYPDTAWISLFCVAPSCQGRGIGTGLYQAAEQVLRKYGVRTVYIGQDYRYLFSGLPVTSSGEEKFFRNLGFDVEEEEFFDLEGNAAVNQKMDDFDTAGFAGKFETECIQDGDEQKLYDFLKQEFPGRWEVEAAAYLQEDNDRSGIVVLKDKTDNLIKGFCMLGLEWEKHGVLGPIGIAESVRGKKVGAYILRESLMQLRRLGAESVYINWAVLKDYYGKFDFVPFRFFRNASKELV